MFPRKKLVNVLAAAQLLLAIVILVFPQTVFPVCGPGMHCHYSFLAETGVASAIIAASACMFVSKRAESARLLGVVSAVCGVFAVLFPSYLIGVCASPMMACHYGLLPVWNLAGGFVVLFSIIIIFVSREEPV